MLITVTPDNIESVLKIASETLSKGGIIAYPTETFYALGAKYDAKSALEKLYTIKNRPPEKTFPLIIGNKKQVQLIANNIPQLAEKLMDKYWPGPLTILLNSKVHLKTHIVSQGKIAVRIPGKSFALNLAKYIDFPITSTSANISGKPPAQTIDQVLDYFPNKIDLIIDGSKTPGGLPSTIVDVTKQKIEIIRNGGINLGEFV